MRTCKILLASAAFATFTAASFAQDYSSPEMPVITSPTLGGGFYMPGSNSNSFYMGPSTYTSSSISQESEIASTIKSDSVHSLSVKSSLSAKDIHALDQAGFLNQTTRQAIISGLSVNQDFDIQGLYASESLSPVNLLLKNILYNLEVQKSSELISAARETDSITQPKVLNFYINAYNILPTCKEMYISSTQNDGSFLISADRRYLAEENKYKTETFYMLFKPNEASNGISSYSVACAVSQNPLDQSSLLYELSQTEKLTAYRTGNLVTMRTTSDDWLLEFLLDLGF